MYGSGSTHPNDWAITNGAVDTKTNTNALSHIHTGQSALHELNPAMSNYLFILDHSFLPK